MKKHLVFIINPKSGTDRVKSLQSAIERTLDASKYTYELQYTNAPKHGVELARNAASAGAYAVIAVGGDGSVNDVVAGIIGTDTVLGIVPGGSGNGMARAMALPLKYAQAIAVLNGGKTERIDIGYANEQPFISNAGVGFDALISGKFAKSTRRGLAGYTNLVIRYLWRYKEPEWQIIINGETIRQRAFIVNVANGQQLGYNFRIAPGASYKDGLLDVVVVKKFPKILGWTFAVRALNGSMLRSPYVMHFKTTEVEITHPSLRVMQTDGDAHSCDKRVRFSIVPHALSVIIP